MGNHPLNLTRFRERVARERTKRKWSQAEVATRLKAMGIDNMHNTTVAKIEAGERDIKLDEAAALAELYGISLDALLGRTSRTQRSLTYALSALLDAVFTSHTELKRNARALHDRLDDIPSRFEGYATIAGQARKAFEYVDAAQTVLSDLAEQILLHIEPPVAMEPSTGKPTERKTTR